jgi:hypothetical protein
MGIEVSFSDAAKPLKRDGAHIGVIAESTQNRTLSGIEEQRARIPEGPESVLERLPRPNVVAVEGDVLPAERSDMGDQILADNLPV